jgi:RNase P subunit RPR2
MNGDEMESEEFPMSPDIIAHEQKKNTHLKNVVKKSDKLSERIVERSTMITYDNNIYIPISLRKRIVWSYHTYLQHPGQNLTWPSLKKDVEATVKNCHECQIGKKERKKYGELPEKLAERPIAWNRVDVDLIGPLTVKTPSGKKELLALTMIDP